MIKRIRIQNFRSLYDVTVDLDPLTVLIGRSGTGKSNFVHAIRFLQDCLTHRKIDFNERDGVSRQLHFDHRSEALAFHLTFCVPSLDGDYHYLLQRMHSGRIEESLIVGERILFHHADRTWVVPPGESPHPEPRGVLLGAIPNLQESTFAYRALCSGIACYDFPSDVLALSGKEADPFGGGFAGRGENYLLVAERIFAEPSADSRWKKVARVAHALNRSIRALMLALPAVDRLDVEYRVNGRTRQFDVRQESEGFRRFLAHVLALYQTPSKQTLIFEHPETGLHPGALEALAGEFKDCPEDGRGQVILTTHSPQLLEYFPVESIRVVDIEHQQSRIGRLAPEQVESVKQRLLLPGELLTVDPARLPEQLDGVPG